jgi:xanthine/CO dehydrogenase XdhC/CoxF family maturation factor
VLRSAAVRALGRPEVVTYDTRSADDLIWGLGLGCGGLMELLLEPLAPEQGSVRAEWFKTVANTRKRTVLATVIDARGGEIKPGDQAIDVGTILRGFDGLDALSRTSVHRTAVEILEAGSSEAVKQVLDGHEVDIAYEVRSPIIRLGVCGSGPDAIPVVAAARRLGWHVTLLDHRQALAASDQWPPMERTVVSSSDLIAQTVAASECDAAIVMNHHYHRDLEYLAAWLATAVPYIGMLGPRQRTEQMLATLESRGVPLDDATRRRIRAPVGLDIGAETPEEVALAIVSEVQAVQVERRGGFLSSHEGPIHGPAQESALDVPGWLPAR